MDIDNRPNNNKGLSTLFGNSNEKTNRKEMLKFKLSNITEKQESQFGEDSFSC
jgi:hypothetical protein